MAAEPRSARVSRQGQTQFIWVVAGPSGCGKSTVAQHLSASHGFIFIEGDDYHPEANKCKMRSGQPLIDTDRWEWLATLRREALRQLSPPDVRPPPGVVITCSALKKCYRDVLRGISNLPPPACTETAAATLPSPAAKNVTVCFIMLVVPAMELEARVSGRSEHFMPSSLVRSQVASLEMPEPGGGELGSDCWIIDAGCAAGGVANVCHSVQDLVTRVMLGSAIPRPS